MDFEEGMGIFEFDGLDWGDDGLELELLVEATV